MYIIPIYTHVATGNASWLKLNTYVFNLVLVKGICIFNYTIDHFVLWQKSILHLQYTGSMYYIVSYHIVLVGSMTVSYKLFLQVFSKEEFNK